MIKILSLLAASLFLLSGCVVNEKPVQEEKPAALEKPAAPEQDKEKAPIAEPAPEDLAPEPAPDAGELQYLDAISPILNQMAAGLFDFGTLNLEASQDPSLLTDPDWISEMAASLVLLQGTSDALKALSPPPEMAEVHSLLLKAGTEIEYVTENYPAAIENGDLIAIGKCTEALVNVGMYLEQATEALGTSLPSY
ncbi:hypothetical protein GKZ89_16605 [Bacillus mangrovi]|uniref:Uncharacterized protein n=1 Tax=Metabacillus mangrovi TaxID=1491830 RepID=A0A7X2S984_9BACI|nr:hypothetical protein [Metabacillus mangrovi]MTH55026.1 hypothetical protein [Metabacillus mangrovi]